MKLSFERRRNKGEQSSKSIEREFPTRMYHGTTSAIDEFRAENMIGGVGRKVFQGNALWLSSDPKVAEWAAMFPFRNAGLYLLTLVKKSGIAKSEKESEKMAQELLTIPSIATAYNNLDALVEKYDAVKETSFARFIKEPKLRNEILEMAEKLADAFNKEMGTGVEIRPNIIPVQVNDSEFLLQNANNMPITMNNWDMMEGLEADMNQHKKGGITFRNVREGRLGSKENEIISNVMAVFDMSKVRFALESNGARS